MTRISPQLRELNVNLELATADRKRRFVQILFDTIESSYDQFTRLFSFGMDGRWKGRMIRLIDQRVRSGGCVLDLATGTGDVAAAMQARGGRCVYGIDLSLAMLRRGARRSRDRCCNAVGDMMALPYPSGSFAGVTAGYAFRNAPDHRAALAEAFRVLESGGWLATLDFYLPESPIWRRMFVGYLRSTGRIVGRAIHGAPEAYGYIASSLQRWISAPEFSETLSASGFEVVVEHPMLHGGIALHVGRRP